MRYLRRSKSLRSVILPFTLAVWLSACHKWTAIETTVDSPTTLSDRVRVTLSDGQRIEVVDATFTGDSLFGRTPHPALGEIQLIGIALDDVAEIERRKGDALATVGLGVGIVGGLYIGALLIFVATTDFD